MRRFGDELSPTFENLRIVDDITFDRCLQVVKGRACSKEHHPDGVVQTASRSLLTGLLYCGHCGSKLCFEHHREHRKLSDGTERDYEWDLYRCYRRISSRKSCSGPATYRANDLNAVVDAEVRQQLAKLGCIGEENLLKAASSRSADLYEVAFKQAEEDFQKAARQVNALEEEAVKALTGESQLDMSVVNAMLLKHRARLEEAQKAMEDARNKRDAEEANTKAAKAQVKEMLTWVERYDKASNEEKHMIIANLVERIEVNENCEVNIQFRVAAEQFVRQTA